MQLLGLAGHDLLPCPQNFKWAVENDAWQARIGSIPQVFAAAAEDMGCSAVDQAVVSRVWDRLLPGLLQVDLSPRTLEVVRTLPIRRRMVPGCPCIGGAHRVWAKRPPGQLLASNCFGSVEHCCARLCY